MKMAILALLLLAAALFQSLTPAFALLASVKFPVLLGVTIYYALAHERGWWITAAILAGLLQDSLSLLPIGCSSLCFVLFGLAIYHTREFIFRDSLLTVAALGGGLAAAEVLLVYGMLRMSTEVVPAPFWWLGLKMGGSALLGLVTAPLVSLAAGMMERHVGVTQEERL